MTTPTIQIAIADDHSLVRKGLISLINSLSGMNVCLDADDGNELVQKIDHSSYQPDICIVDINMKGMNGFDTVKYLKQKYPYIHSLALSFHDHEQSILRMLVCGAKGFLSKTASVDHLQIALKDIYNNGFYFPLSILKKYPKLFENNFGNFRQLLQPNEIEFLRLCCSEMTYVQIGKKMNLSYRSIEKYSLRIGDKLGLHGRISLALYAQYTGIGNFTEWNT